MIFNVGHGSQGISEILGSKLLMNILRLYYMDLFM